MKYERKPSMFFLKYFQILACKDSESGEYCRAEVLSIDKSGRRKVRVRFIDYGNTGIEDIASLAELPAGAENFKKFPAMGLLFKLVNDCFVI